MGERVKVGFANGCYDLFHQGHQHFLIECRRQCDYLVVAVNSDAWCRANKGDNRPHDPLRTRMLHVRAIAEAVVPFEGREEGLIMEIRPSVIFKGYDHGRDGTDKLAVRVPRWKELGPHEDQWHVIPIIRVGELPGFSTTLAEAALVPKAAAR